MKKILMLSIVSMGLALSACSTTCHHKESGECDMHSAKCASCEKKCDKCEKKEKCEKCKSEGECPMGDKPASSDTNKK